MRTILLGVLLFTQTSLALTSRCELSTEMIEVLSDAVRESVHSDLSALREEMTHTAGKIETVKGEVQRLQEKMDDLSDQLTWLEKVISFNRGNLDAEEYHRLKKLRNQGTSQLKQLENVEYRLRENYMEKFSQAATFYAKGTRAEFKDVNWSPIVAELKAADKNREKPEKAKEACARAAALMESAADQLAKRAEQGDQEALELSAILTGFARINLAPLRGQNRGVGLAQPFFELLDIRFPWTKVVPVRETDPYFDFPDPAGTEFPEPH